MQGKRFIHSIRLRNFLSYGEKSEAIELLPLNVLIGTNASGKSNILGALSLLRSLPGDFQGAIQEGGGPSEWIWKGDQGKGPAEIEVKAHYEKGKASLSYRIAFEPQSLPDNKKSKIVQEILTKTTFDGKTIFCFDLEAEGRIKLEKREGAISWDSPVLAGGLTPESGFLKIQFQLIRLYRDWNIGRRLITREPQSMTLPGDFLSEDMNNLALILNNLLGSGTEKALRDKFGLFYEGIERIQTKAHLGKVHISIYEKGLSQPISATRLSDGMLHYLCLLALLLHPEPPPLIAIEEPEIGMHPDMIRVIAELLIEASQRTQIIVTTHSDLLVSCLDEQPESVLVCERTESGSELRRLEKKKMKAWLKKYSLGEMWLMGELGGVRK